MKMVGSGSGGWDVPWSSFEWQLEQIKVGRGIMVFDDGWHKLSTALWLFGPVREVRAWIGVTSFGSGIDIDAPAMISWEHENGVRGVWDITLAPDLYLRSDYYTNDERWEVTGTKGYARVNRIIGRGIQQPSLEVYRDGEMRGLSRARRRLGQQLPGLGPALAALPAHRRGPADVERRARPSMCCGSPLLPTRAARRAASASIRAS